MFEKIKSFFIKIFKKQKMLEETKCSVVPETENFSNKTESDNLREELNKKTEIYNIQKMYEDEKITEDDLRISQIKQLINLYKEQIEF